MTGFVVTTMLTTPSGLFSSSRALTVSSSMSVGKFSSGSSGRATWTISFVSKLFPSLRRGAAPVTSFSLNRGDRKYAVLPSLRGVLPNYGSISVVSSYFMRSSVAPVVSGEVVCVFFVLGCLLRV